MRAWRSDGAGTLAIEQIDVPRARIGEILVRVERAGLNFADKLMIDGRYQVRPEAPFTPGFELCGTVVENGSDRTLSPGARVAAQIPIGAFSDYVAFDAKRAIEVPALSTEAAAALPVAYTTALLALRSGDAGPGSHIAVSAASGGVGLATLQLGSILKARMFALVGDPAKLQIAREHGAEAAFSHRDADWPNALKAATDNVGPSIAIDMVGGDITAGLLKALRWRGRLLLVGFAGGVAAQLPANRLLVKAITASGIFWDFERDGALIRSIWDELEQLAEARLIAPFVSDVVEFEDLPAALDRLSTGSTIGKLVLKLD